MKTILMILHLSNGEVAKLPVTILTAQTCNDKMIEMFKPKILMMEYIFMVRKYG